MVECKRVKSDCGDPAAIGTGVQTSLLSESAVFDDATLRAFFERTRGAPEWKEKTTSTSSRSVISWVFSPYGNLDPSLLAPPSLTGLRPLVGSLLAAAARHTPVTSGRIIPIQAYLCLYESGANACPSHRHGCRQVTLSLGADRTVVVAGQPIVQHHGDVLVLNGQRHAVPKDDQMTDARISLNIFFTTTSEASTASVRAVKTATKPKFKLKSSPKSAHRLGLDKAFCKVATAQGRLDLETRITERLCSAVTAELNEIEYCTIKDKIEPTAAQKRSGFGPKQGSQWHWFIVAKKTITKPSNGKPHTFDFSIAFDKFQVAQGAAQRAPAPTMNPFDRAMAAGAVRLIDVETPKPKAIGFTYGCKGAKRMSTVLRKKIAVFRDIIAGGDDAATRKKRLNHATSHLESLKSRPRGSKTRCFVDLDGKSHVYYGMPVGGQHNWAYADAAFVVRALGKTDSRSTSKLHHFPVRGVRWREVKVGKARWTINVTGKINVPIEQQKELTGHNLRVGETLLIADQVATKLSPTSYHVHLKGVEVNISGADECTRTQSRRDTLEAIADAYAREALCS